MPASSDFPAPREWNAAAYHQVSAPQAAWGERVLARVAVEGHERALDAGCGTGRLTALLLERLPRGQVICLDRSLNMLKVARGHLASRFGGRAVFVQADLTRLPLRASVDLVFSTATLHWVLDHELLFAGLFAVLRAGGRLVAQCGGAGNLAGLHGRAAALMACAPFEEHFVGWRTPWEFADAATARRRLEAAGFVDVRAGLEATPTSFAGPRDYADFLTTVVLRPHLALLPDEALRARFVSDLTVQAALDPVPFTLDYVRLNLEARRP